MQKLQQIKSNQQSKYDEIIEYLKQDNGYWLENDKWDLTETFFIGKKQRSYRYLDFSTFKNVYIKNEVKYFVLYSHRKKFLKDSYIGEIGSTLKKLGLFLVNKTTFLNCDKDKLMNKWKLYLIDNGIKLDTRYYNFLSSIIELTQDFYDDREETEKDIWYAKNIKGVKLRAAQNRKTNRLNFTVIPQYYRTTVKKYFRTIVTKKSFSLCHNILGYLKYFFDSFYSRGYTDGFIGNLTREDIEKYIFYLSNDRSDKNKTQNTFYISYVRTFLEYIQMAQYDKAPKKEVAFLIFQDDIPKRELNQDIIKRTKFIPEPILKQLDNNIMDLDRQQFISVYILLRETGWRGTDILNLRYGNCLEKIWNNTEQKYNYYLCGEITKTRIAELKIPIRDKVAEMVEKCIAGAKEKSTEENNPKKYLFNTYEGKRKSQPINKQTFLLSINRLINQYEIIDPNTNELYHFKLHSLRHTRAKEYVEQGMGISVIQQILGHRSLQMTVHYATVTENTLYEKWKNTEDLDLFRVNNETHELEQVDLRSDDGENLIRYEYVKKNLDAVRVPFGLCFKPSKLPCKQQMNFCLTCASFCTTTENIPEYEEEIDKVKKQIEVSERCGRELWTDKNRKYLELLEDTLNKVKTQKIVHKNGKSREDS